MSKPESQTAGWQKHPTWKPGDPQPRLSNGWYGVRVAADGGFEVLPPSAKPAPLNDMWRVDVAGIPIMVRGEHAKDHLEAVVRQMARMKLALHKLKWEEGSVGKTAKAGLS